MQPDISTEDREFLRQMAQAIARKETQLKAIPQFRKGGLRENPIYISRLRVIDNLRAALISEHTKLYSHA